MWSDDMSFIYTEEWEQELLNLYRNGNTKEEMMRIIALLDLLDTAEDLNSDERIAWALFRCLEISIDGMDQKVLNALSDIDYEFYYLYLFKYVEQYYGSEDSEIVYCLNWNGGELGLSDLEKEVFPAAQKYLSTHTLKRLIFDVEDLGLNEFEDEDEPYVSLVNFFKEEVSRRNEK